MSTHETKLDSPADWERWRRQFQSLARAADLWRVVQGLQTPIEMPVEPNMTSYPHSTPALQTRSQSQAAEDSQSTVQQENQLGPVEFAHLTPAGQKSFQIAMSLYENKMKAYNTQRQGIQKLIDFIHRTVAPAYLENCCDPDDDLDTWFANLKKMAGTSTSQDFTNARDRYNKAIRPLTKIKDYEKWIVEWELAINNAQKKGVGSGKPLEWIEDLFSAVGQVLPEWVNSYRLFSREKVEAGTLIYRDTANDLRAAAAHQAKKSKPLRIGKGAFGPSFAGENAEPLQGDASEQDDEEPADKRKRRKLNSGRGATIQPPTGRSQTATRGDCSSDSKSKDQTTLPSRQKCRGCGGRHSYWKCFYLIPILAPETWIPRTEIAKTAKKALEEDKDFAEEIRQLQKAEEIKKKKRDD